MSVRPREGFVISLPTFEDGMGQAAVGVPLLPAVPQHPAKVLYFPGLFKSRLQSGLLNALLNNFLKRRKSLNC